MKKGADGGSSKIARVTAWIRSFSTEHWALIAMFLALLPPYYQMMQLSNQQSADRLESNKQATELRRIAAAFERAQEESVMPRLMIEAPPGLVEITDIEQRHYDVQIQIKNIGKGNAHFVEGRVTFETTWIREFEPDGKMVREPILDLKPIRILDMQTIAAGQSIRVLEFPMAAAGTIHPHGVDGKVIMFCKDDNEKIYTFEQEFHVVVHLASPNPHAHFYFESATPSQIIARLNRHD